MDQQPQPQVIIVKQQQKHNGCLVTALVFLLFGWLGLAAMALWKLAQIGWKMTMVTLRAGWALFVAYPVRGAIALWPHVMRASRAFHERYGWRGWAILAGVVVALALISDLTSVLASHH